MQEGDNSIVDNLPEIKEGAQDSKDAETINEAMPYINCFSLSFNYACMMLRLGSSLKACSLWALRIRMHFLRLDSPLNARYKNRMLIITYCDYGEKKTYSHEVANSRKIT